MPRRHVSAGSPNEQFIPLATFRVGAYASSGIPVWAGIIDTFRYINEVEGGINGVKLVWDECETEWEVEKGIECYERLKAGKDGSPVPIFLPHGDPIAKALTATRSPTRFRSPRSYGRPRRSTDASSRYAFPLMLSFYSEASTAINYIAQPRAARTSSRGSRSRRFYHDSPYGKETQAALALLAKNYGFEDIQIPVPHPGNDQSAQWARIRQLKPDWVFLRGWGVMTPVAIKTAAKTGFPVDHIIGGIWSSSEEDVIPAGQVGKGYLAITPYPAGTNFPIHAALKKNILDKGKSDLKDPKSFGTVYYNSGIVHAIIPVEAIRTAQAKFGNRPINGEEGQWGLEHLKVDDKRLEELGVAGLMQPLKLSCLDHEGGGAAKVLQWDGDEVEHRQRLDPVRSRTAACR